MVPVKVCLLSAPQGAASAARRAPTRVGVFRSPFWSRVGRACPRKQVLAVPGAQVGAPGHTVSTTPRVLTRRALAAAALLTPQGPFLPLWPGEQQWLGESQCSLGLAEAARGPTP